MRTQACTFRALSAFGTCISDVSSTRMQIRISAHDLLWTKLFYLLMWYTNCSFIVMSMFALQVAQPADEPARPAVPHRFSANIKFISFDTGRSFGRHGLPFPSMSSTCGFKCANLCSTSGIQLLAVFLPGCPAIGNGFFAQDADEKTMRVETLRPFPGTEQLLTNITSLRHGRRFGFRTGVRWFNGSMVLREVQLRGSLLFIAHAVSQGCAEMNHGTSLVAIILFAVSCQCLASKDPRLQEGCGSKHG